MKWCVRVDGNKVVDSDWQPIAEAAWHRATRDQYAGGEVELLRDGEIVAAHKVTRGRGASWPLGDPCGLQHIVKQIVLLLREDGWDARKIAEAMTRAGLATSRARVEAMRGSSGRAIEMCPAEIVTLLHSITREYRG